ncbi:TetR/AcrR family transcriptional regulator [Nocardia vulneris]|uniref:TetR family transcriptional regulator n=1 Tax=Nocardia vulneris TaxID=1141657 RepID=A0ABR4Z3D6_9NOCA|nr:TetR/AcrR family transcriptional regulator [Nocardia vulneris]KIA59845.1 TetR family transcriptional regulator [Nocardia vulneris]
MCADRPYHHGDLRNRLLERAELALREHGVEQLSLRQLARDAGVTHNAPSRHFADKQALLDALAVTGFQRLGAALDAVAGEAEPLPFEGRFRVLARAYLDFAVANPALLSLMFARKHSPTGGTEMGAAVMTAFTLPVTLTADAQSRGEIVDGDPLRIGWTVAITLQGLASFVTAGLVGDDGVDALLNETVTNLIHGLHPRP